MEDKLKKLTARKLWLAPLAGFTDRSFRIISRKCGADIIVTEMVSADGLVFDFPKSFQYAEISNFEKPVGVQLFGSKPEIMAKAVSILMEKYTAAENPVIPDFVDINMGCPVKKVVKREAGSALLKSLSLASEIVKEVKKVLQGTGIYLSTKIRSGWDSNSIITEEAGQILVDSGVDMIIIHPRTRSQMYAGKSDWSQIRKLKKKVSVPVIGNGDIVSAADALEMFHATKCDSIMIGRGVLGRPWIFNEIKSYLLHGVIKKLSYKEKFNLIESHFNGCVHNKGTAKAVREMKSHLCYYTKGMVGGNKARQQINISSDKEEMLNIIRNLYYEQSEEFDIEGQTRSRY